MNQSLGNKSPSLTVSGNVNWLTILWRQLWTKWETMQFVIGLFLILLLALSPLFINSPYYLNMIILTVLYAYVGMAWNIAGGIAGQLLLGHITFFGLGSYTTIVLFERFGVSPWIGILLSAVFPVLMALIFSYLTLRYGLKLDYFALFTLAVMVIMAIVFSQITFVGGAGGIWITHKGISFNNMIFIDKVPYLYISLVLLLVSLIVTYLIYRSKLGKYLMAIREDELAASCLGVNISLYKTLAVVITAALEGMGGGFYVIYTTLIEPYTLFDLGANVAFLVSPIIGGLGTVVGPILGALLNKPFVEIIRGTFTTIPSGSTLVIYGASLTLFILFMPMGLVGLVHKLYLKVRRRFL